MVGSRRDMDDRSQRRNNPEIDTTQVPALSCSRRVQVGTAVINGSRPVVREPTLWALDTGVNRWAASQQ